MPTTHRPRMDLQRVLGLVGGVLLATEGRKTDPEKLPVYTALINDLRDVCAEATERAKKAAEEATS